MRKEKPPTNTLDRAIRSLTQSKCALPEFLRELGRGKFWLLTAFHPEQVQSFHTASNFEMPEI